jgi:hypothetical protein
MKIDTQPPKGRCITAIFDKEFYWAKAGDELVISEYLDPRYFSVKNKNKKRLRDESFNVFSFQIC